MSKINNKNMQLLFCWHSKKPTIVCLCYIPILGQSCFVFVSSPEFSTLQCVINFGPFMIVAKQTKDLKHYIT